MKAQLRKAIPAILAMFTLNAAAVTHYVDLNCTNATPPYTNWVTAATNIQDAVDAATAGAEILVTNGVYYKGARAVDGMSNRLVVAKSVRVRSVNGPEVTIIPGYQVPGTTNGVGAIRCVYLTSGAMLAGFTLTNGATQTSGDSGKNRSGGGIWCGSSQVVSNCVIAGNSADYYGGGVLNGVLINCTVTGNSSTYGGGAYFGKLTNCTLTGNSAKVGGGAYHGTLNNCTVAGNSANEGGGVSGSTLKNCIVFYNTARAHNPNHQSATLSYCCTTPMPAGGTGNVTFEPQLASSSHLSANSPCRGAGSAVYAAGVDLDGELWANPPSIGCDEFWSGSVTGTLSVGIVASFTNVAVGFPVDFQGLIEGRVSASQWDFGDGVVVSNQPWTTHAWEVAGEYVVELRAYNEDYPGGVAATSVVQVLAQPIYYVSLTSTNPTPPYTNWITAATNIQDAVDASIPGAVVLVSNGVYQTRERLVYGMRNRVAVNRPVTVRSVNGPTETTICGYQLPETTNGGAAIRCVYLTSGAVLDGFTLTKGATQTSGDLYQNQSGGGVWCELNGAVLTNCVLMGNSAFYYGGGSMYGTLNNCTFLGNSAYDAGGAFVGALNTCTLMGNLAAHSGGGVSGGTLNNCSLTANSATYGGGASGGTLNNCTVAGNSADYGGGVNNGTLNNCALTGNAAAKTGGGSHGANLDNCTLTGNSAASGGGTYQGTLRNCIVYFNRARYEGANFLNSEFYSSCVSPALNTNVGNFDLDPKLANAFHLSADSPCIGVGSADNTTGTDINGDIWNDPPSVGCDEFYAGSTTGALNVAISAAYTNVMIGFPVEFTALIQGHPSASVWDFGDSLKATNRPYASHMWTSAGSYVVTLTAYNDDNPAGISDTLTIHVQDSIPCHVALDSTNPVPPYATWETAAMDIQSAIDSAAPGSLVLVSNGVYEIGGRSLSGMMTNRVMVDKPITIQSVGGPNVTTIKGSQAEAVRCIYLSEGAVLSGFTLTAGGTLNSGDEDTDRSGGGAWCYSANAILTNCVLMENSASIRGGGCYAGTLNNCIVSSNTANAGGGSHLSTLNNCVVAGNIALSTGGGSDNCILNDCVLSGNTSYSRGGGAHQCELYACAVTGNKASLDGGGTSQSTLTYCSLTANYATNSGGGDHSGALINCTVSGNWSGDAGGARLSILKNCTVTGNSANAVGGVSQSTIYNSIVYFNNAPSSPPNHNSSTFSYSCTTPLPGSDGNFTNAPLLDGNLRLQFDSPCINSGNNSYVEVSTDLGGNPRIIGGLVDIGAFEYQTPAASVPYLWLWKYGLAITGSPDLADPDNDGMKNWQEWRADTIPTNALSVLRMVNATNGASGLDVKWQSVSTRRYFLERATNFNDVLPFQTIATNIPGASGTKTYTDTSATNGGPYFYRVGVQ